MGTGGVPLKITERDISDAIKKARGYMNKAAILLKIDHSTLYVHFNKYPELKEVLRKAREDRDEDILDKAETTLEDVLDQRKDLPSALKAAFFYLNNRGQARGYNKEKDLQADISQIRDDLARLAGSSD